MSKVVETDNSVSEDTRTRRAADLSSYVMLGTGIFIFLSSLALKLAAVFCRSVTLENCGGSSVLEWIGVLIANDSPTSRMRSPFFAAIFIFSYFRLAMSR